MSKQIDGHPLACRGGVYILSFMNKTVGLASNPWSTLVDLRAGETVTVGRVVVRAFVSPSSANGDLGYEITGSPREIDGSRVTRNAAGGALLIEQARLRAEDSRDFARSLERAEFGPCLCCSGDA